MVYYVDFRSRSDSIFDVMRAGKVLLVIFSSAGANNANAMLEYERP